jgi:precorrin-6B methylase 2
MTASASTAMSAPGVYGAVDPEPARRWILEAEGACGPIDDQALDAALGLRIAAVEGRLDTLSLLDRHGVQRFDQGDLTYDVVRAFYRALKPEMARRPGLRLLDLGSGYGRFGFWGALGHGLTVHGLELVAERAEESARVAWALGLTGLTFDTGDLLQAEWPVADVYCMMNAVLPELLPMVMDRLEREARRRRIVVASVSTSNRAFARAEWLRALPVEAEGLAGRELRMWASL